ncbi:oxidoreductase [Thioclava sp. SK-1]|uniref:SDR family oxidoreductase n=1 Tax=Thioclava sp. SK-1 TaxID=1889770 RepID=UPI0008271BB0|nr:SDR family oxidoreductase [Thioclava sp. SK-1]OCX56644.1 oxidoreductase [Thioclava sp. SK-1]
MTEGITGKVVAITGASSGLGAETARHLVAAGAKVVLGARRVDRLEALADELGRENAAPFQLDVTDAAQLQAFTAFAVETFGKIDVMINNAGLMPLSPLEMGRVEEWDQAIDVNIKGVLYGIHAALPYFREQKSGHFINVSSVAGHVISPGGAVYCATKYAVRALTEAFRQEAKPYNIRNTILSPGAVDTELPQSVKAPGVSEFVAKFYEDAAIPASSFARCVIFSLSQPDDMDVNEILFRPTSQER